MNSQYRYIHEIHGLNNVLIDGFKFKLSSTIPFEDRYYFLTHFHSDHYNGLNHNWKYGYIYCSQTTCNFLCNILFIDIKWIKVININEPFILNNADNQVTVTSLDANHCPGL